MSLASKQRTDAAAAELDDPAPTRSPEQELRIARALGDHFESVWRSLRRLGVSESVADDAAQQVFVAFAQRIGVVEPGRERPYLIGIALRVAANFRRQQARSREDPVELLDESPSGALDPESLLLEQQRRERLDEALKTLPDVQRQVFVLYELEGFSMPEIARSLEIPIGAVASRLRRARDAFETWVSTHLPPPGDS
jgi:RNA polymerase sigma-70 factor (ECF subfamily)